MMHGIILADEHPEASKKLEPKEVVVLILVGLFFAMAFLFCLYSIAKKNECSRAQKNECVRNNSVPIENKTRQELEIELEDAELESNIYKTLWITNIMLN